MCQAGVLASLLLSFCGTNILRGSCFGEQSSLLAIGVARWVVKKYASGWLDNHFESKLEKLRQDHQMHLQELDQKHKEYLHEMTTAQQRQLEELRAEIQKLFSLGYADRRQKWGRKGRGHTLRCGDNRGLYQFYTTCGLSSCCIYLTIKMYPDFYLWGGWWDSNPRHSEPQSDATTS